MTNVFHTYQCISTQFKITFVNFGTWEANRAFFGTFLGHWSRSGPSPEIGTWRKALKIVTICNRSTKQNYSTWQTILSCEAWLLVMWIFVFHKTINKLLHMKISAPRTMSATNMMYVPSWGFVAWNKWLSFFYSDFGGLFSYVLISLALTHSLIETEYDTFFTFDILYEIQLWSHQIRPDQTAKMYPFQISKMYLSQFSKMYLYQIAQMYLSPFVKMYLSQFAKMYSSQIAKMYLSQIAKMYLLPIENNVFVWGELIC